MPQYRQIFDFAECAGTAARFAAGDRPSVHCSATMNVSMGKYSFCNRSTWKPEAVQLFARSLNRLLLAKHQTRARPVTPHGTRGMRVRPPQIVVLQRDEHRTRVQAHGMSAVCNPSAYSPRGPTMDADQLAAAVEVTCLFISHSSPLATVAQTIRDAKGLVGVHGAGMANVVFLRPGSAVIELDSLRNVRTVRMMYLDIASALGLDAAKHWSNDEGRKVCPLALARCAPRAVGYYYQALNLSDRALLDEAIFAAAHFARWRALGGAWRKGVACLLYDPRLRFADRYVASVEQAARRTRAPGDTTVWTPVALDSSGV